MASVQTDLEHNDAIYKTCFILLYLEHEDLLYPTVVAQFQGNRSLIHSFHVQEWLPQ